LFRTPSSFHLGNFALSDSKITDYRAISIKNNKQKQHIMKKALFTLLVTCFYSTTFGQKADTTGKPTFNSKLIRNEIVDDFELLTEYYTFENNIANKNSTVYVNDKPTVAEYIKFAMTQPSYFFVVHKGAAVKLEITLKQRTEKDMVTFSYLIVHPGTGRRLEVPSRVLGQISEGRVEELEKLKLDKTSKITELPTKGKSYSFNGATYTIQSFDQVKVELLSLVRPILTGMESAKAKE
jgi:hypothetical protein